jgi:hypothetical protein
MAFQNKPPCPNCNKPTTFKCGEKFCNRTGCRVLNVAAVHTVSVCNKCHKKAGIGKNYCSPCANTCVRKTCLYCSKYFPIEKHLSQLVMPMCLRCYMSNSPLPMKYQKGHLEGTPWRLKLH